MPISDPDRTQTPRRGHSCRNKSANPSCDVPLSPFIAAMVWGTTLPPQPVILQPRPLQRNAGSILLVPLLPHRKSATPLPTEIWTEIFANVYYGDDNADPTPNVRRRAERYRRDLLLVCKALTVRSSNPLISFRLLLMIFCIAFLRWPTSAEHRASRFLLPCMDTVPLAVGQICGQAS